MKTSQLNIPLMLNAAFNKAEIAFLIEQVKFREALAKTKVADDFQSLCYLAQRLLSDREQLNPEAQPLRPDSKYGRVAVRENLSAPLL